MKQTILKLSAIILLFVLALNGCKKDPEMDPVVSVGKQILSFKLVTPATTGVVDSVAKTVVLSVPAGTALTALTTEITLAKGHTINPASGAAQNFTSPITYTITRPDKTTTTWSVSVVILDVAVDQDITASVTWTSDKVYRISGDRTVNSGSVLTIQAGTVIKFDAGASLSIGYSTNGTLLANGTANSPIIFKSSALLPAAGAWDGLYFYDKTLNNTSLTYCNIQHAGGIAINGAVNIYGCDIAMNNCTISNSGSYGVSTEYNNSKGGFVTFANNTINTTAKYGIVLDANRIGAIGTGNTFTSIKGILITGDFIGTLATTWKNLGVPYFVESELNIDGTLTIEPGTTFKFDAGGWIEVGYTSTTTFTADGTSTSPITFTTSASSPAAGAWPSITFFGHTLTNSKMNYCVIDYAGSNTLYGAINLFGTSSITYTNNIVRNSGSYGVWLDWDAGFQAFTNNTIATCAKHLISISTKHLPNLGTPNTLTGSAGKGIEVDGYANYTSPVVWKKQTADFYFMGGEVDIDGDLTIEAGVKILGGTNQFFVFGYNSTTKLTAVGTPNSPIIFTTSASSPAAGAWRGLYFYPLVASNSALTSCQFTYSGQSNTPAIYTEISFPVNSCSILNSASTNKAEYTTGITVPAGSGNNFTWVAN